MPLELVSLAPQFPGQVIEYQGTAASQQVFCDGADFEFSLTADTGAGDDTLDCRGVNRLAVTNVTTGLGNDTVVVWGRDSITVDLGDGNDRILNSTAVGSCEVRGGPGNDLIQCIADAVTFYGGPGADTLEADVIDRRFRGRYEMRFTPANTPKGAGRDTVRNFKDGADKLLIDGDADRTRSGTQAYSFRGRGTNPGKGQIMWYPSGRDKIVTGFDGRTRFEIKLEGFAGALDALDFAR